MSNPQTPQNPAAQGKGLSIAAIILAFLFPLVGLILGIVAMVQSKKEGQKNGLALASIIIGAVLLIVSIIVTLTIVSGLGAIGYTAVEARDACLNGATSVEVMGQTVECSKILAE